MLHVKYPCIRTVISLIFTCLCLELFYADVSIHTHVNVHLASMLSQYIQHHTFWFCLSCCIIWPLSSIDSFSLCAVPRLCWCPSRSTCIPASLRPSPHPRHPKPQHPQRRHPQVLHRVPRPRNRTRRRSNRQRSCERGDHVGRRGALSVTEETCNECAETPLPLSPSPP